MSDNFSPQQLNATLRSEEIPERMDLSAGQMLHFPSTVLDEVKAFATDIDRSVGWCLWMAWCLAVLERPDGATTLSEAAMPDEDKLAEMVTMPLGTWRHVTRESERLDRSKSWLLSRAWVTARGRMADAVKQAS